MSQTIYAYVVTVFRETLHSTYNQTELQKWIVAHRKTTHRHKRQHHILHPTRPLPIQALPPPANLLLDDPDTVLLAEEEGIRHPTNNLTKMATTP
jgi:hypothetical protein